MDDRETVKNKLRDKRVYLSDGVPIDKAAIIAECGRVMKVVDSNTMSEDALILVDTASLHKNDPLASPR